MDFAKLDPEEMFKHHQQLLHSEASRFAHKADWDDLISLGNEVFVTCLARWDPEFGMFSTLFVRALRNAYITYMMRESARPAVERAGAEAFLLPVAVDDTERRDWLRDFLADLSRDAVEVVRVLFTEDLNTEGDGRRELRYTIRQYLRGRNRTKPEGAVNVRWGHQRIRDAYREIETALAV